MTVQCIRRAQAAHQITVAGLALLGTYFIGPAAADPQACHDLSKVKICPDSGVLQLLSGHATLLMDCE